MNSRDLQAKVTKNKIYNVVTELLNQKEFDNISVSEICKKADVSIGTFYYYFNSKRGILFEINKKGDAFFTNDVKPKLNSSDSLVNIKKYLISYIKFVNSDGVELVKHLYRHDNKLFVKKDRPMQNILRDLIIEGQSKNQIKEEMSALEIVNFIFVIMRGIVFDWCLHDGQYDLVDYSKNFIQFICDSIAIGDNL